MERYESEEPIVISVHDPDTGSSVEYKVPSAVAYSINQLLLAISEEDTTPAWDSACRLAAQ